MRSQRVRHDCSHVALSTCCTVDSGRQYSRLCAPRKGGFVLLVAEWIIGADGAVLLGLK